MPRTILLRIDPTATEASWQRLENGQLAGSFHQGELADASRYCRGAHVIVIVPSEEVFITSVSLPGKNRKKLLRAVPYAIEDQLVDDIETLHFALSQNRSNGRFIVSAVEERMIEYWDTSLKSAGIFAETMIPDVLALQASEDSWTVMLEATRALVRSPSGMFCSDIENLPLMLNNLYLSAADERPGQVVVHDCSKASHMTTLKALCPDIEFNVVECVNGPFGIFAEQYRPDTTVNLYQGEYKRQQGIGRHLKPWIPAAALFAVWIGWQLVVNIMALIDLDNKSEILTEQMRQVYKTAFGPGKQPKSYQLRSSMESRMNVILAKQGQSEGSLQEMLVKTAPILKNVSGAQLEGLRYKNGRLDIDLIVKKSSDVDPLKEKIQSQTGWEVKSNATTSKGVTKVRMTVESKS
jgi:general secretion pathway protein L